MRGDFGKDTPDNKGSEVDIRRSVQQLRKGSMNNRGGGGGEGRRGGDVGVPSPEKVAKDFVGDVIKRGRDFGRMRVERRGGLCVGLGPLGAGEDGLPRCGSGKGKRAGCAGGVEGPGPPLGVEVVAGEQGEDQKREKKEEAEEGREEEEEDGGGGEAGEEGDGDGEDADGDDGRKAQVGVHLVAAPPPAASSPRT